MEISDRIKKSVDRERAPGKKLYIWTFHGKVLISIGETLQEAGKMAEVSSSEHYFIHHEDGKCYYDPIEVIPLDQFTSLYMYVSEPTVMVGPMRDSPMGKRLMELSQRE